MEIREAVHPDHFKNLATDGLRRLFLVSGVFPADDVRLVYSAYDRLIVGGCAPAGTLALTADRRVIGAEYLLERREMGVINIGGPGTVSVDGKKYPLAERDGLYVGMGAKTILFESADAARPARFYLNSAPAHHPFPTARISLGEAERTDLGAPEKSNRRTIHKYIQPNGVKSCQLVMGMTLLAPGSVWNTMPPHTHVRRTEAYLYFDLPEDGVVFQIFGEPGETRHIVVRNGEVVLHPSWSIHSGVGTSHYGFIWGMAGENQTFADMDEVPLEDLR